MEILKTTNKKTMMTILKRQVGCYYNFKKPRYIEMQGIKYYTYIHMILWGFFSPCLWKQV